MRLADSSLVPVLALCCLLWSSCSQTDTDWEAAPPARPPNVVLIVVDTLRADHLGCYGYGRPTSPVIDRLAAQGTLFREARAQASWTAPSMVSLMSGRYLTNPRDVFEDEAVPLAERFRGAGYRTLATVGNVILSTKLDYDRGFDRYEVRASKAGDRERLGLCRSADQLLDEFLPLVDRALEPARDGTRAPLFVYFHPMDPHSRYTPYAQFDEELPVGAAIGAQDLAWQREVFAEGGAPAPAGDPGWESVWREMAASVGRYDQEIRFTDRQIGRLLSELKRRGVLRNAIVVLAADHGEGLWQDLAPQPAAALANASPKTFFQPEHDVFLYANLLRTPLILWGVGIPRGLRVETPVENVDLYPTLLELAGLPPTGGVHGSSLVPFLRGEGAGKPYLFARVKQHVSVLEAASGLKLVLPTGDGRKIGRFEIASVPALYDQRADPDERVNLFAERPGDVARLSAELAAWAERFPTEFANELEQDPGHLSDLQALGYLGDLEDE